MTLVQARPLDIRATVPESQLQHVSAGVQGIAEPAGFNRVKLPVIVQRLAAVPLGSGGFDTRLSIVGGPLPDAVMPGMTCEVKLTAYKKATRSPFLPRPFLGGARPAAAVRLPAGEGRQA